MSTRWPCAAPYCSAVIASNAAVCEPNISGLTSPEATLLQLSRLTSTCFSAPRHRDRAMGASFEVSSTAMSQLMFILVRAKRTNRVNSVAPLPSSERAPSISQSGPPHRLSVLLSSWMKSRRSSTVLRWITIGVMDVGQRCSGPPDDPGGCTPSAAADAWYHSACGSGIWSGSNSPYILPWLQGVKKASGSRSRISVFLASSTT
mmetsp:Transcript_1316/g.2898  ORF Transcript_1316/g.2898 Transcript_1316/m.2898 type:complete len:204 (+) Transcript_1316:565-1176(+)